MKIDMVMKLLPEQLSSFKTNIIEPFIDNVSIGEVVAIKEEYGKGMFNCTVDVYPEAMEKVLAAMSVETRKLSGN